MKVAAVGLIVLVALVSVLAYLNYERGQVFTGYYMMRVPPHIEQSMYGSPVACLIGVDVESDAYLCVLTFGLHGEEPTTYDYFITEEEFPWPPDHYIAHENEQVKVVGFLNEFVDREGVSYMTLEVQSLTPVE